MPGVSAVPNPAGPVFHAASSNPGFSHPSAGWSVVYRQAISPVRASGTTVVTTGGGPYSRLAASVICRSSSLSTARSYVISPFTSISTSVVWV